jgi:GGDEF domain-containing protein
MHDAAEVAHKLVGLFGSGSDGEVPDASISIGVAPIHGLPHDVMHDADMALYRAKAEGGNCWAACEGQPVAS